MENNKHTYEIVGYHLQVKYVIYIDLIKGKCLTVIPWMRIDNTSTFFTHPETERSLIEKAKATIESNIQEAMNLEGYIKSKGPISWDDCLKESVIQGNLGIFNEYK